MSFSFYNPYKSFEYGGGSLLSLIGDKSNLVKLTFYRMIIDIIRFYKKFQKTTTNVPKISINDIIKGITYFKNYVDEQKY